MNSPFDQYNDLFPQHDFLAISDQLTSRLTQALAEEGFDPNDTRSSAWINTTISNFSRGRDLMNGKGLSEMVAAAILEGRMAEGEYISPEEYEQSITVARQSDMRQAAQLDAESNTQASSYIELKVKSGYTIETPEIWDECIRAYKIVWMVAETMSQELGIKFRAAIRPVKEQNLVVFQAVCYIGEKPNIAIYRF
jgi:hypothetical protein